MGASLQSSAADLIPMASTSEQSLPGPNHDATPSLRLCLDGKGNHYSTAHRLGHRLQSTCANVDAAP